CRGFYASALVERMFCSYPESRSALSNSLRNLAIRSSRRGLVPSVGGRHLRVARVTRRCSKYVRQGPHSARWSPKRARRSPQRRSSTASPITSMPSKQVMAPFRSRPGAIRRRGREPKPAVTQSPGPLGVIAKIAIDDSPDLGAATVQKHSQVCIANSEDVTDLRGGHVFDVAQQDRLSL